MENHYNIDILGELKREGYHPSVVFDFECPHCKKIKCLVPRREYKETPYKFRCKECGKENKEPWHNIVQINWKVIPITKFEEGSIDILKTCFKDL